MFNNPGTLRIVSRDNDKPVENITCIINGCINKDHKYQRIVYERYRAYAAKIVFRYIYHYEKAMDIVTDGFVKVFSHFHLFNPSDGDNQEKILMGWLKRIMINCAIDALRRNKMVPEAGDIPDNIWQIPDDSTQADQLLLYKDVILMIKELPPNYRAVFNLYVIDGYSHNEIAEMLNMSAGTSKSSLSRARAILQEKIKNLQEPIPCRI
jgi:RNA polymerase sigma-70 factor (ECF subfamily)